MALAGLYANLCGSVAVLDSGAEGPGFKLQPRRCRVTVLGKQGQTITDSRVPELSELIPVLGSQPAGDVSHKPGGRLPLLSARPAVTLATLKRAATDFAAW